MNLNERLKKVRKDAGLKQSELAEKLNIPLRTYRSYEHGERDISTSVLKSICELLGVSSDYLLGRVNLLDLALEPPETTAQRAREMMEEKEKSPLKGSKDFFKELFSDLTESEVDDLMKYVSFLRYLRTHSEE